MDKKYVVLYDDEIYYNGRKLNRIKALKDFDDVKEGDLGGYIGSKYNLSQLGNCWIYDSAMVADEARVSDNAKIYGRSRIFECGRIHENAKIKDNVLILGAPNIHGNAEIYGFSKIYGNIEISNGAKINNSFIFGNAAIEDSVIGPMVNISGNVHISQNGLIINPTDYTTIGPIYGMEITAYKTIDGHINIDIIDGGECFSYSMEEFGYDMFPMMVYTKHDKLYKTIVELIKNYFEIE